MERANGRLMSANAVQPAPASVLLATSGVDVAVARCSAGGGDIMPRANVGMVIEELLTDENLRIRFAVDRIGESSMFRRGSISAG